MRRDFERVHNVKRLKQRRRELRNRSTPAEATLWRALRGRQLEGRKFRRQHSVGPYILDFYCPAERLAIELDELVHADSAQQPHDTVRTDFLETLDIRVRRFTNRQVFDNLPAVLTTIADQFQAQ